MIIDKIDKIMIFFKISNNTNEEDLDEYTRRLEEEREDAYESIGPYNKRNKYKEEKRNVNGDIEINDDELRSLIWFIQNNYGRYFVLNFRKDGKDMEIELDSEFCDLLRRVYNSTGNNVGAIVNLIKKRIK